MFDKISVFVWVVFKKHLVVSNLNLLGEKLLSGRRQGGCIKNPISLMLVESLLVGDLEVDGLHLIHQLTNEGDDMLVFLCEDFSNWLHYIHKVKPTN